MTREKTIVCLQSSVLAFVLSFSGAACTITAYELAPADLGMLAAWCIIWSIAASICFCGKLWLLPLCVLAVLGGFFWHQGTLSLGVEALIHRLSRSYNSAYGWGTISWSGQNLSDADMTSAFCAIAVLVILVTARTVCRRKPAFPAVFTALLPLAACLVVDNKVPAVPYLFALLLGLTVLLLSQNVRRLNAAQGNRLTALAVLPAALVLVILFLALPQKNYTRPQTTTQSISTFVKTIRDMLNNPTPGMTGITNTIPSGTVNLSTAGPLRQSNIPVMEVTADFDGLLYLRSYSYDSYTGTGWTNSSAAADPLFSFPPNDILTEKGVLRINMAYDHPMCFLPYYPMEEDMASIGTGKYNQNSQRSYSYTVLALPDNYPSMEAADNIPYFDDTYATQLPERTRLWAEALLRQILTNESTVYEKAQTIARYVRSSAYYDLDTRAMPLGENDFVRWFLEESETGYCTHFASAATVLLRAAGIPARYTIGCTVSVTAGKAETVRERDSHAWTEYYLPGVGWVVLDATSSTGRPSQSTAVQPSAATQPSSGQNVPPSNETTEVSDPAASDTSAIGGASASTQPGTSHLSKDTIRILTFAVSIPALICLITGQWKLRLYLRQKKRRTGSINERIIASWRELTLLCRLLDTRPDKALFELAQKAKFSQHILDDEALTQFDSAIENVINKLRKQSLPMRLLHRIFFAAY